MRPKLVIFDVDGVLVDVRSSWRVIHDALGTTRYSELYARLYWDGKISYRDWMLADTQLWLEAEPRLDRGMLLEILEDRVSILPDAYDAVDYLRRAEVEVAFVSGGVDILVERVARELSVKLWAAPRLVFDTQGRLIPGGVPEVEADAKHRWVYRFSRMLGIPRSAICVVGDSRIDAPMMMVAGGGVAVNPMDKVVVRAAEGRIAKGPLEAVEAILEAGCSRPQKLGERNLQRPSQ